MDIDPYRLVAFFHVVLFAYWLGADLGVFVCGRLSNRRSLSDEVRAGIRKAGQIIDMGPRTALVLMVPAGLTLASQYGLPVDGRMLALIFAASLLWLWMVWAIFLEPRTPRGQLLWKVDMALRTALTLAFIGYGVLSWVGATPIAERWLAAKIVLFGLILLDGIALRLTLLWQERLAQTGRSVLPLPILQRTLIAAVLLIWAMVATAAFLGVTKPF
jgi:hypothetical protein